jgi:uncharacterized spore protein YtfJ
MEPRDALSTARDIMDARMVYSHPITQDRLVVIPAARIIGGAGGGTGRADRGQAGRGQADRGQADRGQADQGQADRGENATGEGGGFGVRSVPAGAFVIKDGQVTWRPAIDVNKIILGVQLVGVIALLVARSILRAALARQPAAADT